MIKRTKQIEKVREAKRLCEEKIREFEHLAVRSQYAPEGLREESGTLEGWTVHINPNTTNRYGRCSYGSREIELGEKFILHATDAQILDTILHEIAHALVGRGHGHGETWKAMARKVGATPKSRSKSVGIEPRWIAVCGECGLKYYLNVLLKKSQDKYVCGCAKKRRKLGLEYKKCGLHYLKNPEFGKIPEDSIEQKGG